MPRKQYGRLADCQYCTRPFLSRQTVGATGDTWTACCSRSCAQRLRNGTPLEPGFEPTPSSPRPARNCEVCGSAYKARLPEQRACSRACGVKISTAYATMAERGAARRKIWPSSRVYVPTCVWCERLFIARHKRTVVCTSVECRRAQLVASWARDKRRRPAALVGLCECGAEIPRVRRKCDVCVQAVRAAARRRGKQRRKALKLGVPTEPYTLAEIAARDRNQCGLCRKRVAMTKAVPHPKAPTIDHVVPLADGGDDTRANVQLAHFICNSRKCTGGSQQLALIG